MAMKLELRDVHKAFDDKQVLRGIDLEVETHDVVCLIGSSGSGKSTMLKCVNLLVPIDQGEIVLDLSLIHISEPTRPTRASRMPSSA